nr:SirB2 family protein [Wenzhouxiangella sp. XN79A]
MLQSLHVLLAAFSGLGFALRGFVRRVLDRPLNHPAVRVGPHLVDTLLLASGVGLWLHFRHSLPEAGWLGLKLILLVVYIGLGIAAFRIERRERAVLVYLLALGVYVTIVALAVYKPF